MIKPMMQKIADAVVRLEDRLRQRFCEHNWRPAMWDDSPARYCNKCERLESITSALFYAYFGRSFEQASRF